MPKKYGGLIYKKEIDRKNVWNNKSIQVNRILQDMYSKAMVFTADNKGIKYNSGVGPPEGYYLYNLVKENKLKHILEVGMAYGTSALYMCEALKENKSGVLTSIDPFQSTQWQGIGMLNIRRAKLNKFHKLIENYSCLAMPDLITKKAKYDLIFIDGMHLFDYTLIDVFFAVSLLNKNGIIVIDDIRHAGVKKALKHMLANYKFLRYIEDTAVAETMATFVKADEDTREWNFHADF
jgi:predicted O-methyltransferase YrrM